MVGLLYDLGLPPRLVAYIAAVYIRARLTMGDGWFQQGRGVLQGDPLSPFIFNVAIDYVLSGLSQDVGVRYEGETINAIAYADDVVLLSSTRQGMNHLLERFVERASSLGLTLGIGKCRTSGLRWLGRQKKVVLDTVPFTIGQEEIPVLQWNTVCKYLGVLFAPKGTTK